MRAETLKLSFRKPFLGAALFEFLGRRAVAGIEDFDGRTYRRTLSLSHGAGLLELMLEPDDVACTIKLDDLRDLTSAVQRSRELLDLDADAVTIDETLATDPALRPLVRRRAPGIRVPGHVDGAELALRAVLGQQVSVAGAATLTTRLVRAYGKPLTAEDGGLTHLFPEPEAIAEADLTSIGMPRRRQETLRTLAAAIVSGSLDLERGGDRSEALACLDELLGIGPWTKAYIAMRALGDPDAFPASDLGIRRAFERMGLRADLRSIEERAEAWRPWRAYAVQHLWSFLSEG